MLLSIVISFRNEEAVLPELIRRIQEIIKLINMDYEIIFVNDASTDSSLQILRNKKKNDPNIKIINMSRRFGNTPCILAGFKYSKGDAVIYMDADLQDPPEIIPEIINKWRNGAEIVHTLRKKREGENALKKILTKFAYRIINFISESYLPPDCGDFKLLSRKALNELLALNVRYPYLKGIIASLGFKQDYVSYIRKKRIAGKTHYPLYFSLNPYKSFVNGLISFSTFPLILSSFAGIILFFLIIFSYIIGGIFHLSGIFQFEISVSSLIVFLFLGGLSLLLGVQSLYVLKIFENINEQPHYIINNIEE